MNNQAVVAIWQMSEQYYVNLYCELHYVLTYLYRPRILYLMQAMKVLSFKSRYRFLSFNNFHNLQEDRQ